MLTTELSLKSSMLDALRDIFPSDPLQNTALQSFAGLREIMRRIGMPLTDASVTLDSLDSHYHPIK